MNNKKLKPNNSKKEIRALLKAEKRKKEIEEFAKQGLNEYGIDKTAQTWFWPCATTSQEVSKTVEFLY